MKNVPKKDCKHAALNVLYKDDNSHITPFPHSIIGYSDNPLKFLHVYMFKQASQNKNITIFLGQLYQYIYMCVCVCVCVCVCDLFT